MESTMTRVREIREARGLRGAELSRLADISPPTLSKIETGQRNLTMRQAKLLADALNCTVADLHTPVGAPLPPSTRLAPPTDRDILAGIGTRLRWVREHLVHQNINEAAKFLQVTPKNLVAIERGDREMGVMTLVRAALRFGVSSEFILLGRAEALGPAKALWDVRESLRALALTDIS